jgi:tetratricopeptide (TPR) repeat protein
MDYDYITSDGESFGNDISRATSHQGVLDRIAKEEAEREQQWAANADFKAEHNSEVARHELETQTNRWLELIKDGTEAVAGRNYNATIAIYTELLNFKFHSTSGHKMAVAFVNAREKVLREDFPLYRHRLAIAYASRGFYQWEYKEKNIDKALDDYKQAVDILGPNGGPPGWMDDESLETIVHPDFQPGSELTARITLAIASIDYEWTYYLLQEKLGTMPIAMALLAELFYREGRIVPRNTAKANALLQESGVAENPKLAWAKELWSKNPPTAKTRNKPVENIPALDFLNEWSGKSGWGNSGNAPSSGQRQTGGNTSYSPSSGTSGQTTGASGNTGTVTTDSGNTFARAEDKKHGLMGYGIQIVVALIAGAILGGVAGRLLKWLPLIGPFIKPVGALVGTIIGFVIGSPHTGSPAYQNYQSKKTLNKIILIVLLVLTVVPQFQSGWRTLVNRFRPKTAVEKTTTAPTATVTADALNMRAEPAGSAALVKTLKKGDTLTVTGSTTEDGWVPVEHDGATGYVSGQYIE